MAETTTDLKEWKKGKLDAIRNHHLDLIRDLGISPFDFNMKKAFYDSRGVQVVGIFASEFLKEKGFFFELISSDLDPIDPQRKVYKVPYCSSFEDEYELNPKNSYNVPLEELRVVNPQTASINKTPTAANPERFFNKETPSSNPAQKFEDAPYGDMTIRDYIAIHTGKPISNKAWLNDLIKNPK